MNKLQLKNLERECIRKSHGKATKYAALVKGNSAVVISAKDTTRYSHYLREGYTHIMSAIDGNVMELF
jgi:hypothetical protein